MIGVQAQPVASTPEVGQVYYLYNPITKLFMTTNVDLPFVRPTGTAWRLEAAAGHDGWITLRLKDNNTEGCGYFWGKWWANNPAQNSADYADERVFKLVNTSGENYKLQSYAWGATEAYIYVNNGNSDDRSCRLACNSQDQAGLDEGYVTWQFISEADYAAYMTKDYTANIQNNDFLSGTANWTLDGGGNKQPLGNTAIEHWQAKAAEGNFDYYQNVVVPAGKYVLRAAMFNSTNGEEGASFSAPGQCGVYGTSNNVTKNANVSVDGNIYNIYTTEELLVPDGNLRLGFKNTEQMTARWFGADWIQLTCIEYCLSTVAEALPANGAMTAGKWYKYDVVFDGNYSITAATSANIIQTTDGTQMEGSATGEAVVTGDIVPLTAGTTIYYKSSSDNTLVVAAASYSYSVSEATADKTIIQPSNTVTVNFAVSTNDPSATLAQDYSGVTFDGVAINVTPGANGFTFTVPANLEAGVAHTLYIPAGAIGYAAGSTYNVEQSIVLNAVAVFDGVYYLYDATNKLFLGRGANYGTRAVADKYGIAMNVTTNTSGITNFTFLDGDGNKLFDANGGILYTDNKTYPNFAIESTSGGYYVVNKNTTASSTYDGKLYIEGSNVIVSKTNSTVWTLLTDAERDAIVDAYPTDNINTVIAAAGISTTAAEFESFLATNYGATDKTDLIGTAKFAGSVGDWNWAQVKSQGGQPAYGTNFAEVWVATGTFSQTVDKAVLPAGIYKLTVDGFERRATVAISNEIGAAGYNFVSSYFAANDEQVRLTDWYTTSKPGNTGGAVTAFNNGEATNELYIYLDGNTDLNLKLAKPNYLWDCWTIFNNFTLTFYEAKATPAEKAALADAIAAAEAKTLGFEEGEYAPYNNKEAFAALAAAKDINPETASGEAVVNATTALTGATWTANTEEVNAVWDGSFEYDYRATTPSGNVNPYGWQRVKDAAADGYNVRYMDGSNVGLAATSSNKALFTKQSAYYGYADGYTMPLKANTLYKLTFVYGGWGDCKKDGYVSMTDPNGNAVTLSATDLPVDATDADANPESWKTYTAYFTTGEAGNYVLGLRKKDNDTSGQSQYVYGDIVLKKSEGANLKVADGKLGTFVAPFDVVLPENVKAYYASVDGDEVKLTKAANGGDALTAGTPVIVYGDGADVDETFYGIPTEDWTLAQAFDLWGILAESSKNVPVGAYVLQTQGGVQAFYKVSSIAPGALNRCYVKVTEPNQNARLTITFEGEDPTGINAIEAAEAEEGTLKDGKYSIDNKIVIVKNGVKYSANGQKLN